MEISMISVVGYDLLGKEKMMAYVTLGKKAIVRII